MDDTHYRVVAQGIREGRVVPFLGAGVNLCGRSATDAFEAGRLLPSGAELAKYLALKGAIGGETDDLVRVSQHLSVVSGMGPLYETLHDLFDHDYPPTELHRFLAELPGILRTQGSPAYQMIVTTNYDDALERAFAGANEPLDVVIYMAKGKNRGKFLHCDPEGNETVVAVPNKYHGLSMEERTVLVKIHGAVDRDGGDRDSYVITEDNYIDYLTETEISELIPVKLATKISRSHFLFLGYSLRDWNLRVILHRIWGEQELDYKSWAVLLSPDMIDELSWQRRNVDIIAARLDDYVTGLRRVLAPDTVEAPA